MTSLALLPNPIVEVCIDRQRSRHSFGGLQGEMKSCPVYWYDELSLTLVLTDGMVLCCQVALTIACET